MLEYPLLLSGNEPDCNHEEMCSITGLMVTVRFITTEQQGVMNLTVTMRKCVQSLASLSGLRIQCSHELWYSSLTWLESGVAVAVV